MKRLSNPRRLRVLALSTAALLIMFPSGANAAGTFWDDDGNPHEPMIEAIASEGITQGCAEARYCPDQPVTRAQMASFLVRAFDLPQADGSPFSDISASPHAGDIVSLAASGITNGCAADSFCPSDPVTRAEMAAFLTRAQNLSLSAPDAFGDDDGNPHEPEINAIAAAGITNGCGSDTFCPFGAVSRAEMASFLGRSLGLSPIVAPVTPVAGDVYVTPAQSLGSLIAQNPEGTVFVLAPGTHLVDNVAPKNGQQFLGEEGAILSGNDSAVRAMGGSASNVTLDNLVIERYASGPQGSATGATGPNWTVTNSEFRNNSAVGLTFNSGWIVRGNFIHHNRQLGVKGYGDGAVLEGNTISDNNYNDEYEYGWEAGATKFIRTKNLIVRNNVIRDNHGPGLWADTENENTLYEGNLIENNHGPGILHEVSYSATIRDNTIRGNAFQFYFGGILISSSRDVTVTGNVLEGNDGGVIALQDDRSGPAGPYLTDNFIASGNTISHSSGVTGLWSNVGAEPYSRNIQFTGNSYRTTQSEPFHWDGTSKTWAEWQSYGHDTSGSFE